MTYHLKLLLLTPDELDCLVLYCRKHAAEVSPNPNDNREKFLHLTPEGVKVMETLSAILTVPG